VTGVLEKYKKQTQIKVFKASQIKVLAAPKPTPAKKKS
jgi:DNA/RNA endonuclease YhcR with UshA esterase domain